ncbi:hypothetical protein B0H19DRAFT_1267146 [Mycena capillaripes]|nr:hypothetical protein B0H19DRAFT_1267146 [Mycena capillaripes]
MFTKVLAFGLAALKLVRAALATDLQAPLVQHRCPIISTHAHTGSSKPGVYKIFNVATKTQLRANELNSSVFVSYRPELPGTFGEWNVEKAEDNTFKISNEGLKLATYFGE